MIQWKNKTSNTISANVTQRTTYLHLPRLIIAERQLRVVGRVAEDVRRQEGEKRVDAVLLVQWQVGALPPQLHRVHINHRSTELKSRRQVA